MAKKGVPLSLFAAHQMMRAWMRLDAERMARRPAGVARAEWRRLNPIIAPAGLAARAPGSRAKYYVMLIDGEVRVWKGGRRGRFVPWPEGGLIPVPRSRGVQQ